MDEPYEDADIKYLGNGKFILKSFKNIWFNSDGTEKKPFKVGPLPPPKIGTYTCINCLIRTDCPRCPICSRDVTKTPTPK